MASLWKLEARVLELGVLSALLLGSLLGTSASIASWAIGNGTPNALAALVFFALFGWLAACFAGWVSSPNLADVASSTGRTLDTKLMVQSYLPLVGITVSLMSTLSIVPLALEGRL